MAGELLALTRLRQQRLADAEASRLALVKEHEQAEELVHRAGRCPAYPALGSLADWQCQVLAWVAAAGLETAVTADAVEADLRTLSFAEQRACALLANELTHALGLFAVGVLAAVERKYGPGERKHGGRMLQIIRQGVLTEGERLNAAERAERAAAVHARAVAQVVLQQKSFEDGAANAAERVLAASRERRLDKAWHKRVIDPSGEGGRLGIMFAVNVITGEVRVVKDEHLEFVHAYVEEHGMAALLRDPLPPSTSRGRGRGRGRVMR